MTLSLILIMVIGVSMNPTYVENDLLWNCTPESTGCGFSDVKIGDVISFASSHGPVVHRVVGIEGYYLITQGDNTETNPEPIPEVDYVTAEEYSGKIASQFETNIDTTTPNVSELVL
jgi:signal peptidase I